MTAHGSTTTSNAVIFVGSDIIGRGEDRQLGSLLMQKFLHTLGGFRIKPKSILLMNDGVRLVTEDSIAFEALRQLGSQGVDILACGTCIERFGLNEKVAVGKISNMYDITDAMLSADKVITL
jgi:selenium metabolism protein YedF